MKLVVSGTSMLESTCNVLILAFARRIQIPTVPLVRSRFPHTFFVKFPIPGCGLAAFVGLSLPIPEAIGLALAWDKTLHMPQNFCRQGI